MYYSHILASALEAKEAFDEKTFSNLMGPNSRANFFAKVVRGGNYGDAAVLIRVSKRSQVTGSNLNADTGTAAYLGDFTPWIGFRCASDN